MAPLRGEGDFHADKTTGFGGAPAYVFLFRERGWVGELGDSAGGNVIWIPGMCLRSRANICFSSDAILEQSLVPPPRASLKIALWDPPNHLCKWRVGSGLETW